MVSQQQPTAATQYSDILRGSFFLPTSTFHGTSTYTRVIEFQIFFIYTFSALFSLLLACWLALLARCLWWWIYESLNSKWIHIQRGVRFHLLGLARSQTVKTLFLKRCCLTKKPNCSFVSSWCLHFVYKRREMKISPTSDFVVFESVDGTRWWYQIILVVVILYDVAGVRVAHLNAKDGDK